MSVLLAQVPTVCVFGFGAIRPSTLKITTAHSIEFTAARLRLHGLRDLLDLRQDTICKIKESIEVGSMDSETRHLMNLWMSYEGFGEYSIHLTTVAA